MRSIPDSLDACAALPGRRFGFAPGGGAVWTCFRPCVAERFSPEGVRAFWSVLMDWKGMLGAMDKGMRDGGVLAGCWTQCAETKKPAHLQEMNGSVFRVGLTAGRYGVLAFVTLPEGSVERFAAHMHMHMHIHMHVHLHMHLSPEGNEEGPGRRMERIVMGTARGSRVLCAVAAYSVRACMISAGAGKPQGI